MLDAMANHLDKRNIQHHGCAVLCNGARDRTRSSSLGLARPCLLPALALDAPLPPPAAAAAAAGLGQGRDV